MLYHCMVSFLYATNAIQFECLCRVTPSSHRLPPPPLQNSWFINEAFCFLAVTLIYSSLFHAGSHLLINSLGLFLFRAFQMQNKIKVHQKFWRRFVSICTQLTLEGPSTSIDVFSFRNACKMPSVKSYDTIFSEFYFFINTCLLSKFQDFSASGYRKKYVTT